MCDAPESCFITNSQIKLLEQTKLDINYIYSSKSYLSNLKNEYNESVYSNSYDSIGGVPDFDIEFSDDESDEPKTQCDKSSESNLCSDTRYYSMIKPELLIVDIIELPEYSSAKNLLGKIKSGNIERITRSEEDNFNIYLNKQITELNSSLEIKIESKFILILYIMFYSKYHLTHNFKYYYWNNFNIIITSWKTFSLIIKYYFKFNESTFIKYIGWIGFIGSNTNIVKKKYSCDNFTNTNVDLNSLDIIFKNRMRQKHLIEKESNSIKNKRKIENQNTDFVKRNKQIISGDLLERKLDNLIDNALELIKSTKKLDDLASCELLKNRFVHKINQILEKKF